jgi:hypothetical protein
VKRASAVEKKGKEESDWSRAALNSSTEITDAAKR